MIHTNNFEIPESYLEKWQKTVDLMTEFLAVPVGLFMRVQGEDVQVLVASRTETNPFKPNERVKLDPDSYCKKVVTTHTMLQVRNALEDPEWEHNPGVEMDLIAYMGVPVFWPDGNVFGTLCVMDRKERNWPENFNKLICQFKDLLEADLCILVTKINREYEEDIIDLIENLPYPTVIRTLEGKVLTLNENFTSVFGFSLEDLPTQEAWIKQTLPDKKNREEVLSTWTRDINYALKENVQIPERIYKLSCKDGSVKDTEVNVNIFKGWMLLALNDVTEKLTIQKELKESEEKFRTLFNSASDMIIYHSPEEGIYEINDTALNLMGITKEQTLKKSSYKSEYELFNSAFKDRIGEILQKGRLIFEVEFTTSGGKIIPVEVHSKTVYHKGKEVILSLCRDISERKQWQKRIWNSVIQAEEKERGRIARDLHDGLGPILSAIKLNTQWLSNPDKVTNEEYITGELNRTIDEAVASIKEISNNLSPHLLCNHGLVPAIKSFIDKLKQASTIRYNFQADLNDRLHKNSEIAIYRICTECINNAIKYAEADSIDIKLYKEKEKIKMLIEDDGIGFDVKEALNKEGSNGLINITNRIKNIGGNIEIESKMGKGTIIVVEIINE